MIRFYCQYSFGGFRTFRIDGKPNENLVEQEVTEKDMLDFPKMGDLYFNYGGAKLLYRMLDNGELAIVLKEIPGIEKDTDGRLINCALEIIASPDDKELMDNITLAIVSNLTSFQKEFVDEFSLRGGLHYNGEFLVNFVDSFRGKTPETSSEILANLSSRQGPVYLLIPSSPLFMTDSHLQAKVIRDLHLGDTPAEQANTIDNTISPASLATLEGSVTFVAAAESETDIAVKEVVEEETNVDTPAGNDEEDNLYLKVLDLERMIEQLEEENGKYKTDIDTLRRRLSETLAQDQQIRKILSGLAIGCAALALGWILTAIFK